MVHVIRESEKQQRVAAKRQKARDRRTLDPFRHPAMLSGSIQVNTTSGDTMDGMTACPGAPLGYVGEGKVMPMIGKQYDPNTFPVTTALKDKGISEVRRQPSAASCVRIDHTVCLSAFTFAGRLGQYMRVAPQGQGHDGHRWWLLEGYQGCQRGVLCQVWPRGNVCRVCSGPEVHDRLRSGHRAQALEMGIPNYM